MARWTDDELSAVAVAGGTGRIRAGGVERDVDFTIADPGVHDAIDAAYHAKYDRYGPRIVGTAAADVTFASSHETPTAKPGGRRE